LAQNILRSNIKLDRTRMNILQRRSEIRNFESQKWVPILIAHLLENCFVVISRHMIFFGLRFFQKNGLKVKRVLMGVQMAVTKIKLADSRENQNKLKF
jgi:hypothetical protein